MQLNPPRVNCLDTSSGCKGVSGHTGNQNSVGTWGEAGLEPTGQPPMGLRIHSIQHDLETVKFHPRILRSVRLRDNGKGRSEVNS